MSKKKTTVKLAPGEAHVVLDRHGWDMVQTAILHYMNYDADEDYFVSLYDNIKLQVDDNLNPEEYVEYID